MTIYDRGSPGDLRVVDRWEGGVGWLAHPEETGQRASHAVRGDDGVWVFDPIDAPGVDDLIATLGEVAGVAVLSNYHARDAGAIASRHGVPVSLPRWMDRVEERVDAPVERFSTGPGESGFEVRHLTPLPGWQEGIAFRDADGTLYVPDLLGTVPAATVGDERIGVYLLGRLFPPRDALADLDPERILVGHGTGIFEDAGAALSDALDGARRRFPAALARNGWTQLRSLVEALGD